jgi:undecaprenyl-diphosphatase
MSLLEAIILGIVQGATEFIPISSSAHLILVPELLSIDQPGLPFIGVIHLGTLLAVLIYFARDLWAITKGVWAGVRQRQLMSNPDSRLGWFILIGTIPAAAAGLLFKDWFERIFESPIPAAFFLLVTGVLLIIGERILSGRKSIETMTWMDSLAIGTFQMLALFPGISRSGSTIVGGLWRGLNRETAARFSFLLSIPAIAGAGLLSLSDVLSPSREFDAVIYIAGFLASFIAGYVCIKFLLSYLKRHSLYIFAAYCFIVGGLFLVLNLLPSLQS